MVVQEAAGYHNMTSSANVSAVPANLIGIFCSTTSSGTVTVYDDAATGTGTPVTGAITLTAGTWYKIPAGCSKGIYVAIANTANVTVFYA